MYYDRILELRDASPHTLIPASKFPLYNEMPAKFSKRKNQDRIEWGLAKSRIMAKIGAEYLDLYQAGFPAYEKWSTAPWILLNFAYQAPLEFDIGVLDTKYRLSGRMPTRFNPDALEKLTEMLGSGYSVDERAGHYQQYDGSHKKWKDPKLTISVIKINDFISPLPVRELPKGWRHVETISHITKRWVFLKNETLLQIGSMKYAPFMTLDANYTDTIIRIREQDVADPEMRQAIDAMFNCLMPNLENRLDI